jgi:hypothetical protein
MANGASRNDASLEVAMMAHLLRREFMAFAAASESIGRDPARLGAGVDPIFTAAVARALPADGSVPAAELTKRLRHTLGPEAADIDADLASALIAHALDATAPAPAGSDSQTVVRTKVVLTYGIVLDLGLTGDDVDALLRAGPPADQG